MDSPFKDILHTNAVPSDADCQRIGALLVGPRKEAEELTQEIGRIQAMLNDLAQKRDRLANFIDAHLALVSGARRLPDDVVQEIFEATIPPMHAVMRGTESPLLLCQICRPWRRIALSTPRLWASLHVVVPPSSKIGKINNALNVWISRSGSVPLSFSFLVSQTNALPHDVSPLLKTLTGVAHRWKNVRLLLPTADYFAPLSGLSPDDVPMLQSAVVEGFGLGPDASVRNLLSFLGAATLHSVSLQHTANYDRFPLRWQSLVHLSLGESIHGAEVGEALAVLHQCPNLQTFKLILNHREDLVAPTPCRLEHLSQLCLFDWWPTSVSFLSNLVLPSLRRLEYVCYRIDEGQSLPFLNLLSPDNQLECLSLSITHIRAECVREALSLVPLLRELCVVSDPVVPLNHNIFEEPSVFALLTRVSQESTEMLCPRLRSIRMMSASISDDGLLEFIRSRTSPHPSNDNHLSQIHVGFRRPMLVDIMPSLEVPISNGLEVSLRYDPPAVVPYSPYDGNQPPGSEWAPLSAGWHTEADAAL